MKNLLPRTALLTLALTLLLATAFRPAKDDGYRVGDKVEDFRLKSTEGKLISLDDYATAKGAIVVFSCNHCPWVKRTKDRLNDLGRNYKDSYPLLAVNSNDAASHPEDSYDKMKEYHKKWRMTYPYLHDETQAVAKAFGAKRTPHVYLLKRNAQGELVVAYIGAIDDNAADAKKVDEKYLENAIAALEAGKDPNPDKTKAIGCSIKWAKN